MATDEVMKNYFARFIGHEMMFMVFSIDFHGIFTNLSFIVEGHQNRLRLFWTFFIICIKQGEVSKTDPSEIDYFDKRRISQPKNQ